MNIYPIKIEAIQVNTDNKICPGMAKTKQGETFTLTARTPASGGICRSALGAIDSMAFSMMMTDKMEWEKKDYFEMICPHGAVRYRLSRIKEEAYTI